LRPDKNLSNADYHHHDVRDHVLENRHYNPWNCRLCSDHDLMSCFPVVWDFRERCSSTSSNLLLCYCCAAESEEERFAVPSDLAHRAFPAFLWDALNGIESRVPHSRLFPSCPWIWSWLFLTKIGLSKRVRKFPPFLPHDHHPQLVHV
jgi:hypothetical protein